MFGLLELILKDQGREHAHCTACILWTKVQYAELPCEMDVSSCATRSPHFTTMETACRLGTGLWKNDIKRSRPSHVEWGNSKTDESVRFGYIYWNLYTTNKNRNYNQQGPYCPTHKFGVTRTTRFVARWGIEHMTTNSRDKHLYY